VDYVNFGKRRQEAGLRPNGLALSPDESKLYVVEAAVTPRVIVVFDVVDGQTAHQ
jgi:sugar lactone lactonase YvrE